MGVGEPYERNESKEIEAAGWAGEGKWRDSMPSLVRARPLVELRGVWGEGVGMLRMHGALKT